VLCVLSAHLFAHLIQSKVTFQTASDLIRSLFVLIIINNCEEIYLSGYLVTIYQMPFYLEIIPRGLSVGEVVGGSGRDQPCLQELN
jgi:hypothetical protein